MKPINSLVALLPCIALTALTAQNTIVSPVQLTNTAGSGGNVIPWSWGSANHYMQLHSDVTGSPKLINRLSFRQSAGNATFTGTRAQDLEVFMGHTRAFDLADFTFANNYMGPRIPVVTRKVITMGPQGPQGSPSPFQGMEIPLDVPFPYNGTQSLGWEVQLYAQPLTGTFNSCDADGSSQGGGSSTAIGTGCIATGRTTPATQTLSLADVGGHLTLAFQLANGPASAPTVLAFGVADLNLTVPGLCSPLHTTLTLMLPVGSTNASGAIPTGGGATFYFQQNPAQGASLFTQFHSLDAGRTDPIPVTNSNGRNVSVPFSNLSRVLQVTRLYAFGSATNPTMNGDFFGIYHYGIATRFHY